MRSRRAGISAEEARHRPLYTRVLGLQYLRPSSLLCFLYFEGAIALAALLALAELVNWWVVAVLPASVAAMVKLNDVIAGAAAYANAAKLPKARGTAKVPQRPAVEPVSSAPVSGSPTSPAPAEPWVGSPEQRARQSAMRRYE